MYRGLAPSGFNPSKEKYRCPVQNCNSEFQSDDISRHFTKNLVMLCEALEQVKISRLDTNDLNKSAAMETIEKRIEKKVSFADIVLARYY